MCKFSNCSSQGRMAMSTFSPVGSLSSELMVWEYMCVYECVCVGGGGGGGGVAVQSNINQ